MSKTKVNQGTKINSGKKKVLKYGATTIALTSSLALSGLSQSIKAEEQTSLPSTSNSAISTPTVTPTVTPTQMEMANQAVIATDTSIQEQTQVVNTATNEVTQANTNVAEKTNEVTNAQEVADNATPTVIANQQNVVSNASEQITTINNEISSTNEQIVEKNNEIGTQTEVVNQENSNVAVKTDNLNAAKDEEKQAQAILDGTGATDLYKKQDSIKSKVIIDNQNVNDANTNLTNAIASDSKLQSETNNKATEVSNKATEVTNLSSQLPNLENNVVNTTNTLNLTKTNLDKAKADVNGINTFVMTNEYANALKLFNSAAPGSYERDLYRTQLNNLSKTLINQNNYKSNTNDKLIEIPDINNLSKDILKELSLFGSELENQIRSYFGTPKTVVSPDSIDMADLVTDGYVADSWGWNEVSKKGHDINALNIPSSDPDTNIGTMVGEDLNTYGTQTYSTNLDHLKYLVFEAYKDYMYLDLPSNYAHARSVSGLSEDSRATTTYIGIDISSVAGATNVHVNNVNNLDIAGVNEFDSTVISNPDTPSNLKASLTTAQTAYDKANTANSLAISKLASVNTQYNQAKNELATLVKQLEVLKATPMKTADAQTKLNSAKAILATDQKALNEVNAQISTLESDVATKKANLDIARAEVAKKTEELNNAVQSQKVEENKLDSLKEQLSKLKSTLSTQQIDLANAKINLAVEQTKLFNLTHAQENLDKAKLELMNAEALLSAAKNTLSIEEKKLEELLSAQTIAKQEYAELLALYNEQEQARLEKEKADILANGEIPIPVYNQKGILISYNSETKTKLNKSDQFLVSIKSSKWNDKDNKVNNMNKLVSSEKKLPQTGSNNGIIIMMFGLILVELSQIFGKISNRKQ